MPVNQVWNPVPGFINQESLFIEDLINESIRNWGQNVIYLPRTSLTQQDNLYGESPASSFTSAFTIEMYLSTPLGPEGTMDFFSKFGLEIKDSIKFVVARRAFKRWVPSLVRPREGDLIWVPAHNKLYEIKFVNQDKEYHQLGRKPPSFFMFEMSMEVFKFSNERFSTGVGDIDSVGRSYSYTIGLQLNSGGTGNYVQNEVVYQGSNLAFSTASAIVKSWTAANNYLQVINIKGIFASANVTGNTSGALYSVNTYNQQDFSGVLESNADNVQIENEGSSVINFTNQNPFGEP